MGFGAYSVDSVRWTVASEWNGPNRAEAKIKGLTLKRDGRMRRYYNEAGELRMAYSYNTCILAWDAPSEDFPQGRPVLNLTRYSVTSNNHLNVVLGELAGKGGWCTWWSYSLYQGEAFDGPLRIARELLDVRTDTSDRALVDPATVQRSQERVKFDHAYAVARREERRRDAAEQRKASKRRDFRLHLVTEEI